MDDLIDLMLEDIMRHKETLDPNESRYFTDIDYSDRVECSELCGQFGIDQLIKCESYVFYE